jgi:hypothetical protein
MTDDQLKAILKRFDDAKQVQVGDRILQCWLDFDTDEIRLRGRPGGDVVAVDEHRLADGINELRQVVTEELVASVLLRIYDRPEGVPGVRVISKQHRHERDNTKRDRG